MSVDFATRTDVGRRRDHNEDSVLARRLADGVALLAVADGMGGHAAGDVASQLAVETLESTLAGESLPPRSAWEGLLDSAVTEANRAIREHPDGGGGSGMGTTLVAALVGADGAVLANVGDSRAYVLDDERIEQVTVDQSLVQQLVEQGQLTRAEAEDHPQRNVVSQALGTEKSVEPDFYEVAVEDTLLLCSDGLTEEVDDATVHRVVTSAPSLSAASDRLVERANDNGGSDNVSVVLGAR